MAKKKKEMEVIETVEISVVEPVVESDEFASVKAEVVSAIDPYLKAGMKAKVMKESMSWHFVHGNREDSGTLIQPIESIVRCAHRLMPHVKSG